MNFFLLITGEGKKQHLTGGFYENEMSQFPPVILPRGTSNFIFFNNTEQHCGIVAHGENAETGFSQSTSPARPYSVPVLRKPALQAEKRPGRHNTTALERAGKRGGGEKKEP